MDEWPIVFLGDGRSLPESVVGEIDGYVRDNQFGRSKSRLQRALAELMATAGSKNDRLNNRYG